MLLNEYWLKYDFNNDSVTYFKNNRSGNITIFSGMLYKHYESYAIAFFCAGCPPIIGAIIMCGMYFTKVKNELAHGRENLENGHLKNGLVNDM